VTLELWKGVFSHNFGIENLMVQSVSNEHQCMIINFYVFSAVQWVSLIFHKSLSYLTIIFASKSDIRIVERNVFTPFWYGKFNAAICFWWASIYVHQLLCFQCWSVSFL